MISGARDALQPVMQALSRLRSWYASLSPVKQTIIQDAIVWSIAFLCVWWVTRGVALGKFLESLKKAKIGLFLGVNIGAFFWWWLAETYLFATLFSFFHKRTAFRELLPATMAQYFLQSINLVAADGALVVFLNRRKGVKWLTAAWTMMFQGLIDAMVLSGITTLAGLLAPRSKIRFALPYAGGAFAFLICVALWWAWGKPKTRPEKWMYNRPSARAFREAGLREYLTLGGIRLTIIVVQGFLFYYSIYAFTSKVPLKAVLALTPGMLAATNEPITPAGLGPLQVVVVAGLSRFAPRDRVLAAALGISIMHLLCRLPLGIGAGGTFARRVLAIEASEKKEKQSEQKPPAEERRPKAG
ncbi:MAG: lysylphosphatidylglycerol synthase domain-containing protein [Candidatus Binataceae bacterium]